MAWALRSTASSSASIPSDAIIEEALRIKERGRAI
jgi:hypothetical protein